MHLLLHLPSSLISTLLIIKHLRVRAAAAAAVQSWSPSFSFSFLRHYSSPHRQNHLVSLLRHCSNLTHLQQTHGFMIVRGLDQDDILLSQFIHCSGSLGFSAYAYSVFSYNARPSIFLYNNIIWALSSSTLSGAMRAISLFNEIQLVGLRPDFYSFPYVLKAVVYLSAIAVGWQVHCQAIAHGLDSNVTVAAALIRTYSSCGYVSYTHKLFDGVSFRDVSLWNAMVACYARVGDMANARNLFECMPEKNVISWTTVISGYTQSHNPNEAILLFQRMQLQNVRPDEIAILAVLSACADLGALGLGEWIHNYIEKHKLKKNVPLCNSLIDMYAKSGNISKALQVFENTKHKTVITWTTMISGLALNGLGMEALQMFSSMERAGVKPNKTTFIALLSACSHVGLIEVGRHYFTCMGSKYGMEPEIQHYGCMIDLLARSGYLSEAKELVRVIPVEANAAIWGSLLAASTRQGDAELSAEALCHLIKLEPHNSGNYTLLSNIYAALGRWKESGIVRKIMRNKGVGKMPGVSYVELNNRVYEFIAGDKLSVQFGEIYDFLRSISEQMRMVDMNKAYMGSLSADD